MAEHCSKVAQAMGVEHLTYKAPWSDPPFPPRPAPGQAFENTARIVRYHGLFQSMTRSKTNVIAFGHHSDDQIETSLIRLGRGTTELGAGGMKRCRRWGMGMGHPGAFGWFGHEGMNRWIMRPLLGVNKVKSAATAPLIY
jgi:tRNA(Ile)-lysidine synthase